MPRDVLLVAGEGGVAGSELFGGVEEANPPPAAHLLLCCSCCCCCFLAAAALLLVSLLLLLLLLPVCFQGAHHLDLMFSHPLDPPSVTAARATELQHISGWIEQASQPWAEQQQRLRWWKAQRRGARPLSVVRGLSVQLQRLRQWWCWWVSGAEGSVAQ